MEILWREILKDPSAQRYGRRGQRQHGVDIVGLRNRAPNQVVGIQCKLKGQGTSIEEQEIRDEVKKALGFRPHLAEFVIVTTAPDDAKLQTLALELSGSATNAREIDLKVKKDLKVSVFGWGSLEREILRYPEALKAFDPSHTPWGERLEQHHDVINTKLDTILNMVTAPQTINPELDNTAIQTVLDRQISDYAETIHNDPETALDLLRKLQQRLDDTTPEHVRYRVAANIAACQLELGQQEVAAQGLVAAYDLAPDDPKAVANKAFGLLLQEDWAALRAFAEPLLLVYPNNATLAACYIHGLIDDKATTNPLDHIPKATHGTAAVAEAHVRWLMDRGEHGVWWDVAMAAHETHPDNVGLKELCASALLERAIDTSKTFDYQPLTNVEREETQTAIGIYETLWPEIRDCSHHVRSERSSVPINLMSAYRMLDQSEKAIEVGTDALVRFPDDVTIREQLG